MKKALSLALSLVLVAVLLFALGTTALAAPGEETPEVTPLSADFTIYSACYNYGEEVNSVVIKTAEPISADTVAPADFSVYVANGTRKTVRTVESVVVNGDEITLTLKLRGSATNTPFTAANFKAELVGEVTGVSGTVYGANMLTFAGQVNEQLDRFIVGQAEDIPYRLFVPEGAKEAPLYVWLHGGGEFGTDNRAPIVCANLPDWTEPAIQNLFGENGLYILSMQSPNPKPHEVVNMMKAILDVCANYNIDMSRIYVAGCSQGGKGTNRLLTAYPDLFAAAISDCPYDSVLSPEAAAKLTNVPIIYLQSLNDTTATPANSMVSYDRLKAAGSENVWCCFYDKSPANSVTGRDLMGHFSWAWLHSNATTTEPEFHVGTGTYVNNKAQDAKLAEPVTEYGKEYSYTSTPLSEVGKGYASFAAFLADQSRETISLTGDYTIYSTCYDYGEEAHTVVLKTVTALDPATVQAADFAVSNMNSMCGYQFENKRTVESVEVDGTTVTLNLKMTGSGANAPLANSFKVSLVGEVTDNRGNVYDNGTLRCVGQVNPELDQFAEFKTADVQYRLYSPETEGKAPLYIWLHGAGEFGTDNRSQVSCSSLVNWIEPEVQSIFGENGAYIMAVQSPTSPHKADQVMAAITEVCSKNNIDMNRIYLAGCSMGGMGVHTMITTYPEFFAAAAPNCPASVITAEQAKSLVNLPMLYVHAKNDGTVKLSNSILSYNNIKAAGNENIYCTFFETAGNNPVTGRLNDGHWSWTWIHKNFTSNEAEFIDGLGSYDLNGTRYDFVSTPLSKIDNGYANIAEWFAAQSRDAVMYGDFNFYSTCYTYGEEANKVVLTTPVPLDPATVEPSDFETYFMALSCGSMRKTNRTVESVEVKGNTVTLNLKMTGSGTNAPIGTNFFVSLKGEVADKYGNTFTKSILTCLGQINPELDAFKEYVTEDVQYRLFAPKGEGKAPLYIWLHGMGEFGTDNRSQVSCSNLVNWTTPEVQSKFGANGLYVMAVQSPKSPHNANNVMDAILDVCKAYDIDMSRIYLAGCSMGGMGVHTMITTFPTFFAAAAPNCPASTITPAQAKDLVNLPMLYVHAKNDGTVKLTNSIDSYNNIKAAGNDDIYCTFFETAGNNPVTGRLNDGHWSWTWIHSNFTSTEAEFINGEGTYTNGGKEYTFTSTPLADIDNGYATIADWFAAHVKTNVVSVENIVAEKGQEITFPVRLTNATGVASYLLQLDSSILTITDIEPVSEGTIDLTFNAKNGMISWVGETDLTGDELILNVTATVADNAADGEYLYGMDIISMVGAVGDAELPSTSIKAFIAIDNQYAKGDINQDGDVSNADLVQLAKYLVDLAQLNAKQLISADVDGNGIINNADLVALARVMVNA